MRWSGQTKRGLSLVFAGVLSLPLAACGGAPSDGGLGSTLGNLIAFNSTTAPPLPARGPSEIDVECPEVLVAEGQSAMRTYAGADRSNASLRHQYSFGEMSRECRAVDGKVDIRVGVSGYVLAGPLGGPGSFQAPVRISVRRDSDGQIVQSRTSRVAATIAAGQAQADFAVVSEPLTVPLIRTDVSQDYSIFVGFDGSPDRPQQAAPKRRGN